MKKTVSFVLALLLALCLAVPGLAVSVKSGDCMSATAEQVAAELKAWGLFQGVSDTEFDLYRKPTRTEALVMLIRTLGKEEEVKSGSFNHPFKDVPAWAQGYVGYAYENGLTLGVSATEFGASMPASADMYLTFMLRALGYSETLGDFTWDKPGELAQRAGILSDLVDTEDFYRRDVVLVSHLALYAQLARQGEGETLASKLGIDLSVHPVGPVSPDCGLLAEYFNVDIFVVTTGVDYINRSLIADGYKPDYRLKDVQKRIDAGEFRDYIRQAKGEDAYYEFLVNETYKTYMERLSF